MSLATAKRVEEPQSLSFKVAKQGEDLLLSYMSEFFAKTDTECNPVPRGFRLRNLASFVGQGDEEWLLCPVEALRYRYVTFTHLRPRNCFSLGKGPTESNVQDHTVLFP